MVSSIIAPACISESSPPKHRGRLASPQQLALTSDAFAALLSDALFANAASAAAQELLFNMAAWRWMFLVALVPAIMYYVIVLALLESPASLSFKARRGPCAANTWLDAGGADRHCPVHAAEIRRHQRQLPLLLHAVARSWLPGKGIAGHLHSHGHGERPCHSRGLSAATGTRPTSACPPQRNGSSWIANFRITHSLPEMASVSLPTTRGIHVVIAGTSFFFVTFKDPETNGMSPEQAEPLFIKMPMMAK